MSPVGGGGVGRHGALRPAPGPHGEWDRRWGLPKHFVEFYAAVPLLVWVGATSPPALSVCSIERGSNGGLGPFEWAQSGEPRVHGYQSEKILIKIHRTRKLLEMESRIAVAVSVLPWM